MHLSNSPGPAERSTILLVEDEDLLREMLEETLVEAGYGVLSAASGEAAADLLVGAPLPRALVTDVNLGRAGIDGWALARLAREHDPSCAILYVSGGSAHRWASNGVPRSIILPKPFAPAQLVEALSDLLIRNSRSLPARKRVPLKLTLGLSKE
ncbi:response regulator [Bradyrhizobium sp. 197]|uniref:response regulator n=2 Tax=Bradyrhizobium TaxID=374 RepID=UPI001FF71686|nr:response regulator [Bradyrhizobium sp. 197]MCK1480395.1 response regulator [Bradyrhizobium sp. 197]